MHSRVRGFMLAGQALFIALLFVVSHVFAANGPKAQQIMGRVSESQSGYIKIGSAVLLMTPSTQITSQSQKSVQLAQIDRRDLVYVTFKRYSNKLIAEQIHLLDLATSKRQQSFRGPIQVAKGNRFLLDGVIFNFDEFTIRMGETLEKAAIEGWQGTNAIVVATEKASGLWVAEFIREDYETTAMVQ